MNRDSPLYKFLIENGFKVTKEIEYEDFGDKCEILTSPFFHLQYSTDRLQGMVDIKSVNDDDEWWDVALVKALIYDEKKLNIPISVEELNKFILNEFDKLKSLFNRENYLITKEKLDLLGNQRSRQMFPGLFKNNE